VPNKNEWQTKNLVLRIKTYGLIKGMRECGIPPEQLPPTRALCGELLSIYAFESEASFTFASPDMLEKTGLTFEQVHNTALENTVNSLHAWGVRCVEEQGVWLLRVEPFENPNTHLEANILLCPDIVLSLENALHPQGRLLVCVPTGDHLFLVDSGQPENHAQAYKVAQQKYYEYQTIGGNHALSLQWMVHDDSGWKVVELPGKIIAPCVREQVIYPPQT